MIIPDIWENKKCSKPPTSSSLRNIHYGYYPDANHGAGIYLPT